MGQFQGAYASLQPDHLAQALAEVADEVLLVPTEGTSFFASLTGAMAMAQPVVATLATIAPERTMASMTRAEQGWAAFGLMQHSAPVRGPQ
ncbi:hypothetical protein HJ590_15280 [Naumannella sp. ID2617S]|nr:hypothetical protein [Naumannella sp. ID2617S]